jgi:uncharacterized protein YjiS (DUF1127 family)
MVCWFANVSIAPLTKKIQSVMKLTRQICELLNESDSIRDVSVMALSSLLSDLPVSDKEVDQVVAFVFPKLLDKLVQVLSELTTGSCRCRNYRFIGPFH